MNYEYHQSPFSKAMLTGVFVGFVVTIICLIYNIIYRDSTGFLPADFINVSSLIFAVNLLFWLIGIVYFILLKSFKKGNIFFLVLFGLFAAFCIWRSAVMHRWDDTHLNAQFKGLLEGILVIMTIGIFIIPYLFHNKKFEEHVL
jgi:hypothetical protein